MQWRVLSNPNHDHHHIPLCSFVPRLSLTSCTWISLPSIMRPLSSSAALSELGSAKRTIAKLSWLFWLPHYTTNRTLHFTRYTETCAQEHTKRAYPRNRPESLNRGMLTSETVPQRLKKRASCFWRVLKLRLPTYTVVEWLECLACRPPPGPAPTGEKTNQTTERKENTGLWISNNIGEKKRSSSGMKKCRYYSRQ